MCEQQEESRHMYNEEEHTAQHAQNRPLGAPNPRLAMAPTTGHFFGGKYARNGLNDERKNAISSVSS